MLTLTEINIYPIKSLGGISLQSSIVEERGLKFDRRWMLIENENKFITQRTYPQMALLKVEISNDDLIISHKTEAMERLFVPFNYNFTATKDVIIWNDIVPGSFYKPFIDSWFSNALGVKCRLVYMPDSTERIIENEKVHNNILSFADGYPFLIIGSSSLDDLNSRLKEPLPMNRFRPNFVFNGGRPYEEDDWNLFRIGDVTFRGIKPSSRCSVTTVDQETGETGKEPLATLSTYRKSDSKVFFGMNLVCNSTGEVKLGNKIELL